MLERDVFILNQFREQISGIESGTDDSWTRYKDTDQEKIFYKLETGFTNCTLFMQKVIEAPAINLMATLAEAQLYNQWVPLTRRSAVLAKVSNFRRLAEFEYKLPFPLYPRWMHVQACGMQLEEENACILTMSSPQGNSWLGTQLKDPELPKDNRVFVTVHKAAFYCKEIGPNK